MVITLIYDYSKKLNNDIRYQLSYYCKGWEYYKDNQFKTKIVIANFENKDKLETFLDYDFRGDFDIIIDNVCIDNKGLLKSLIWQRKNANFLIKE